MRARDGRFVFVHGRKAGGSSIKDALAPFCDPEDQAYLHSGVLSGTIDKRPHLGVWDRAAHQGIPIIANVRNPFDRAVSAWRYFGLGLRSHGRRMGFEDFVRNLPPPDGEWTYWMHATASYCTVLVDEDGPMWTHLIRFETLAEDFAAVTAALGLGPLALGHSNAGERRMSQRALLLRSGSGRPGLSGIIRERRASGSHRDFYTVKARRAVEEAFADDLERFGYTF